MRKKEAKAKARARKGKRIRQVAALPYRRRPDGGVEFLMVSSRGTGRLIFPKGWPMKGKSGAEAAAKEAGQEAGVAGRIDKVPIGQYRYWKRLNDAFVPVTVAVFALEVDAELELFGESKERARGWLRPEQAELLVDDPELKSLIREAHQMLDSTP